MRRSISALAILTLCSCTPAAPRQQEEVTPGEAHSDLSEAELGELRHRAEGGDREAVNMLAQHYLLNFGDENEHAIHWQLEAVRLGDCETWRDLMFMEVDWEYPVPAHLFREGETLRSLGDEKGCPPYVPSIRRPRRDGSTP